MNLEDNFITMEPRHWKLYLHQNFDLSYTSLTSELDNLLFLVGSTIVNMPLIPEGTRSLSASTTSKTTFKLILTCIGSKCSLRRTVLELTCLLFWVISRASLFCNCCKQLIMDLWHTAGHLYSLFEIMAWIGVCHGI